MAPHIRRLVAGDEALAELACRTFGIDGGLDIASFLSRPETSLLIFESRDGVAGWVYGHGLVHPDVSDLIRYSEPFDSRATPPTPELRDCEP